MSGSGLSRQLDHAGVGSHAEASSTQGHHHSPTAFEACRPACLNLNMSVGTLRGRRLSIDPECHGFLTFGESARARDLHWGLTQRECDACRMSRLVMSKQAAAPGQEYLRPHGVRLASFLSDIGILGKKRHRGRAEILLGKALFGGQEHRARVHPVA